MSIIRSAPGGAKVQDRQHEPNQARRAFVNGIDIYYEVHGDHGGTPLVHTVRGVGYVLRETPTPDS